MNKYDFSIRSAMALRNGGEKVDYDDEYDSLYREVVRQRRAHPKPDLRLIHDDVGVCISKCEVPPELKVIQGSRTDAMWCRLMLEPESFTFEEFEFYTEVVFRELLTPSDEMALMEMRSSHRVLTAPTLEDKLFHAIMMGDDDERKRIHDLLARRKALDLRVIDGTKK